LGERLVDNPAEIIATTCCIAGGGPAGMMLGFLLARAGTDVVVLEKHADFLRDFRGDTVHPSTLELMYELGLLEAFLQKPHDEVRQLWAQVGPTRIRLADFSHVPTHCKFLALMPQWDFLDFLSGAARTYPGFHLMLEAEVTGLIEEAGRIQGVRVRTAAGERQVRALLTVGCDGRHSAVRAAAGLVAEDFGSPMDVLWFRLSRKPDDEDMTFGHAEAGRLLVMLNRDSYWQCAYVIPKGSFATLQQAGLPAFLADVVGMSPFLADRTGEIAGWDQVKLLTVTVDRLRQWWRPGLLCIGDAAHAMSPIGGVGINLAVQDAVAAANLLAAPLADGEIGPEVLAAVQRRREFPTRATQRVQRLMQDTLIGAVLGSHRRLDAPWPLRLVGKFPLLQRLPARIVGVGVRPEHIRTPDIRSAR
jgi:2-polyprenyl-6-methoxyphenol hydroxylase-like FAD-dependent oxidoreductase